MKLVTVSQMRTIEQQADANGLTYAKMMENAGLGLAQEIEVLSYSADGRNLLALVGAGNNGGDALVALAHLAAEGWQARAYLVRRKAQDDPLVERLKAAGGEVLDAADDLDFEKLTAFVETADVVVDGVLGTGLKLPLKPEIARVLDAVNQAISRTVLAALRRGGRLPFGRGLRHRPIRPGDDSGQPDRVHGRR
jgi:ADP-dependent NAD(P)H-hydrate dehydratase / NAD(P)H-hydrate epimerase